MVMPFASNIAWAGLSVKVLAYSLAIIGVLVNLVNTDGRP